MGSREWRPWNVDARNDFVVLSYGRQVLSKIVPLLEKRCIAVLDRLEDARSAYQRWETLDAEYSSHLSVAFKLAASTRRTELRRDQFSCMVQAIVEHPKGRPR